MLFDVDIEYESIDNSMDLETLQDNEHKIDSALRQMVKRRSEMARKFKLEQAEAAFTFYIILRSEAQPASVDATLPVINIGKYKHGWTFIQDKSAIIDRALDGVKEVGSDILHT